MTELTTTEAAAYLAERGYTVRSRKTGAEGPPAPDVIKRWCVQGKLAGRKRENRWLIPVEELERLVEKGYSD